MKHLLLTTIAAVVLVGTAFAGPIHTAAKNGDLARVQKELDGGADVNAKDDWGLTPLDWADGETADLLREHGGKSGAEFSIHVAAGLGNAEAVKQHLDAGVNVNAKDKYGGTPLHSAAWEGHKEVVELLIAEGADVNAKDVDEWTALHMAYTREVAVLLIDNGADVNAKTDDGQTPLDVAVDEGLADELADFLRKRGGKTSDWLSDWNKAEESIHIAVRVGHIEAVKQHLAAGTDVNAKDGEWGYTLLHSAVGGGHKDVAELLIAEGADVNAKWGEWDQLTPLHRASRQGHKEIVELLIANGADVNVKDFFGETPLDWANDKETADLLRKHGGKRGSIHAAVFHGDIEAVKELLAAGANVNARERDTGRTPLDFAIQYKHPETAELLRKHGGKTAKELWLMPRLVQHGRFAFSFDAKEGKVYEVQDSFDLLNWEVIKTYTGTGDSVRFDEERDHDPPKWFYRVRVVE